MKNIIIINLLLLLFSCNGKNSKNSSILKEQRKINLQKFDIGRFKKNKNEEGICNFKDSLGNDVKEEGDSETGYTENRKLLNNLFYVEYKEYYSSGKIKVIGKTVLDNTAVGVPVDLWEYFDENGNLEKEIDENKKFGKFGPNELLQFLADKKIINSKTGEGWYLKDKRNAFTIDFDEVDKIWKVVSSEGDIVPLGQTGEAIKPKYYYLINSKTGEIKEEK